MARLDYLDPPGEIADQIRERRDGELRPLDKVLLHSPELAQGWNHLLRAVRQSSSLPADVREVVILRVAVLNRASYEWDAHAPIAQRNGLSDEGLEFVRTGTAPSPLTPGQQTAYDFATELTRDCRVGDGLFRQAEKQFGQQGVVDLSVTVGAYNMVSRFLTALDVDERLQHDDLRSGLHP